MKYSCFTQCGNLFIFCRLANIEKEKIGHLYNRRSDFRVEYSTLEELERSMTASRKTESKWWFGGFFLFALLVFFYSTVCLNALIISRQRD